MKKKTKKIIKRAWSVKNLISNLLWFFLGGLWLGLLFVIFGALLCVTIIGISLGKQCFTAASVAVFPYGKKVFPHEKKQPIANSIWALLFGWELALICVIAGIACCMTVIGFFKGLQAFKLSKLVLLPFGAEIQRS